MFLDPSRVSVARQRVGDSKASMANALGVTPRTLATWETQGAPSSRAEILACATDTPTDFFFRGPLELLDESRVFFRARRRAPASLLRRACALGALGVEFFHEVTRSFRLPELSLTSATAGADPLEAARDLRAQWVLGAGPLPNLVQLAEAHGIRVLGLPLAEANVDAFSFWAQDGRPFVFLSRTKTAERSRFDLAHEIGHLVLHGDTDGTDEATDRGLEAEANAFAAEFLMPQESVASSLAPTPSLDAVLGFKRRFGVSAVAAARAAKEAGRLSEWAHRQMLGVLAERGFIEGEPGSTLLHERSKVFAAVLDRLRSHKITPADWALSIGLRPSDAAAFTLGQALTAVNSNAAARRMPLPTVKG